MERPGLGQLHGNDRDLLKELLISEHGEETQSLSTFGDEHKSGIYEVEPSDDVKVTAEVVWEEVKKLWWIAGPMIGVNLFQYSLRMISVMMVGHLGELALSSASIATSFANVTGLHVLGVWLGILCGLCAQAILLFIIMLCTDWEEQAKKARERIHASGLPAVTGNIRQDEQ